MPTPARDTRWQRRSFGFTLLEMLIALGVVLLVAGAVWPALLQYLQRTPLIDSGRVVQNTLDAARIAAIDRGVPYHFVYEPGGRRFMFLPAGGISAAEEEVAQTTDAHETLSGELPEGFQFVTPDDAEAGTFAITAEMIGGTRTSEFAGANWSTPAVYYPDGSGTDYFFEIEDDRQQYLQVSVRKLTGASRVSKLNFRTGGGR